MFSGVNDPVACSYTIAFSEATKLMQLSAIQLRLMQLSHEIVQHFCCAISKLHMSVI